jgi:hypothetical protein
MSLVPAAFNEIAIVQTRPSASLPVSHSAGSIGLNFPIKKVSATPSCKSNEITDLKKKWKKVEEVKQFCVN